MSVHFAFGPTREPEPLPEPEEPTAIMPKEALVQALIHCRRTSSRKMKAVKVAT